MTPPASWVPATEGRTLTVLCSTCPASTVNEQRRLRGWQQSTRPPRRYRCPTCATRRGARPSRPFRNAPHTPTPGFAHPPVHTLNAEEKA